MAESIEESASFTPNFDAQGLIPVIVVSGGDILMFAHMNAEALELTRISGHVHFWSRSRACIWQKGEISGETLKVRSIHTDCDQDVLLIDADMEGRGAVCHTGRRSCFYRKLDDDHLVQTETTRIFDPAEVYKSSTRRPKADNDI